MNLMLANYNFIYISNQLLGKFMKTAILILIVSIISLSCADTKNTPKKDIIVNENLLKDIAEVRIIPFYNDYINSLELLKSNFESLLIDNSITNLDVLKDSYINSYIKWQYVAAFEIGKAKELTLRSRTNIYPIDSEIIDSNINSGNYNLEDISNISSRGFPALDYLLYSKSNEETIGLLNNSNYSNYIKDIINELLSKTNEVKNDWDSGYKDTFKNNNGTDLGSSLSIFINAIIKYYEENIRSAKIATPSGQRSDYGLILPKSTESFYAGKSLELLKESIESYKTFFQEEGKYRINDYLISINAKDVDGNNLNETINAQLVKITSVINKIDGPINIAISTQKELIAEVYNELQYLVKIIKVDMIRELSVQVNFLDNDGD